METIPSCDSAIYDLIFDYWSGSGAKMWFSYRDLLSSAFWDLKEAWLLPKMVSAVLSVVKSCKILLKPLKLSYRFTDVFQQLWL
jgi:hypothetical protein